MLFRNSVKEEENCWNLKIEGWVNPKNKNSKEYSNQIKQLQKDLKQLAYELKGQFLYKEYIVDLDLRASGIKFGKKSYMKCDIVLMKGKRDINIELFLGYFNHYFQFQENFELTQTKHNNSDRLNVSDYATKVNQTNGGRISQTE